MEYGPALESRAAADAWLASHKHRFGHYIKSRFIYRGAPQFFFFLLFLFLFLFPSFVLSLLPSALRSGLILVDFGSFFRSPAFKDTFLLFAF